MIDHDSPRQNIRAATLHSKRVLLLFNSFLSLAKQTCTQMERVKGSLLCEAVIMDRTRPGAATHGTWESGTTAFCSSPSQHGALSTLLAAWPQS